MRTTKLLLSCGLLAVGGALGGAGIADATPTLAPTPNWTGYADTLPSNSGYTITSVSATWNVPTVQAPPGSSSAYSSIWVGIDGFNENTLEQIGIDANVINGQTQYDAWYEMLPADPTSVPITIPGGIPIKAGDVISASASYNTSTQDFTLAIRDLTAGNPDNFSIAIPGSGQQRLTGEWIVEDPTINGSLPTLADFSPVTFANAQGSVQDASGVTSSGPIDSAANIGGTTYQLWMDQNNVLIAGAGNLLDSGSGSTATSSFTAVYVPEPDALALLAAGAMAFGLIRRERAVRR